MYRFEHAGMRFTPGSFAETIALDRYAVYTTDPKDFAIGDTVVFIADAAKGTRKVGVIEDMMLDLDEVIVKDRDGEHHNVPVEYVVKPLETNPSDWWHRWSYIAALEEAIQRSVFSPDVVEHWTDQFSWLFDGYRYSPGGRIQLGLGHEYLGLPKAPLTLVNCFVGKSVECGEVKREYDGDDVNVWVDPVDQWAKVLASLRNQIEVQRRGGGYGINITNIATVSGAPNASISAILNASHPDYHELDALRRIGKLDGLSATYSNNPKYNDVEHIEVDDSIDGIINALHNVVKLAYDGRRIVVDFSGLRPRHAPVSNIGRSSGAASWMTLFALAARLLKQETIDAVDFAELFAYTTNLVEQGGSRRGALMLVYNVDGPVIEKFITRKREPGRLVGANVSVGVSDEFMKRVKRYDPWKDEDTLLPLPGMDAKDREAHRIWTLIVESAHASAEPGVIFIDRYNKESNSWYYAPIDCTNPCGEQGLPWNGACNLGHLVLPRFVKGDWTRTYAYEPGERRTAAWVDWDELERAVRLAVRFQDLMVDYTNYPTSETKEQQRKERRVGIGTMGLGTLLIMLGLRYGSDDALDFIDKLYANIAYWAYDESINIAAEKGSFPAFNYEKYVQSGFMKRLLERFPDLDEKLRRYGIRNVTLLTQAPTGTTGAYINGVLGDNGFPGVSSGIEPYYAFGYERTSRIGTTWIEEPIVRMYREKNDLGPDDPLPDFFVTAQDLTPEDHVRVQAAIQRWVDSSISKTINMPATATVDDVSKAYLLAYDLGCKGVTVYVDGSRQAQVLSTEKGGTKLERDIEVEAMKNSLAEYDEDEDVPLNVDVGVIGVDIADGIKTEVRGVYDEHALIVERAEQTQTNEPNSEYAHTFLKRPHRAYGFTEKIRINSNDGMTKVYVTINIDENGAPFEVFINANDPVIADTAQALGRIITQMLRYGCTKDNVAQVVKHLKRGQSNFFSLPMQIARLIEEAACLGVEFPKKDDEADGFRGLTDAERESRRQLEKATTTKIGTAYSKQARKLVVCPECGEESYDKVACYCHSCGASRCF